MSIVKVSIEKYRAIAHDIRRAAREKEFAPLDDIIAKQIPVKDAAEAEAARQVVRDKYTEIQTAIDFAETPEQIKSVLGLQ